MHVHAPVVSAARYSPRTALRTSMSVPVVRANTARAQMLWTATHARARADGKGTTAGLMSMTVRLHHAIMMGVAQIVPTRIFASVPPDGAERTAQMILTSVPAVRASTARAQMLWTATHARARADGKGTTARPISMTVRLHHAIMMGVAQIVPTRIFASVPPDGAERTVQMILTSVPVIRASTARAQMLWTATHARARADGKGTTAGLMPMTVRLHHAIMMGVAQIVPTRIFASVPPDGAERTAQRTSTSVPVVRALAMAARATMVEMVLACSFAPVGQA